MSPSSITSKPDHTEISFPVGYYVNSIATRIEFTIAAISCTRYDLGVPIIGKKPDFEL